ncbi:MAG: hypothetical protein JWM21_2565 [Acidobacteria bacterium]|nr:hypothetical protein [Acidobacteriota bacterium]
MKILALTALVILTAFELSPRRVTTASGIQTYRHIYVDNAHLFTTPISGFKSSKHDTLEPGSNAFLVGLEFDEKSDKPCFIRAHWWRYTAANPDEQLTTFFDICKSSAKGDQSLVFTSSTALRQAVDGIQVCSNNDKDHRMKGVKLSSAFIDRDAKGKVENAGNDLKFERPNCSSWKDFKGCSVGMVAIGLNIEHSGEEITGLGLHCTQPTIKSDTPTPGSTDSDKEKFSKMEHDIRVAVNKDGHTQTMSIKDAVARHEVNAATVVVIDNRKISAVHHYGVRSRKSGLPANDDTLYPTASLSKFVSSVGMLIAADKDEGPKLVRSVRQTANDFPNSLIARWVNKQFKGKNSDFPKDITISHLLSHTAGLDTHTIGTARHDSKTDMTNILMGSGLNPGVKPLAAPGTLFEYSGGGFVAAESMLETHSGRTATNFLNKEVLEHFHLTKSTFNTANDDMVNLARGCSRGICSDKPEYTTVKFAGGLLANPEEYARLLLIIMNDGKDDTGHELLPFDRVKDMLTPAAHINSSRKSCTSHDSCPKGGSGTKDDEKCYNGVCILPVDAGGTWYGLGVGLSGADYAGFPTVLSHSGGQDNVSTYFHVSRGGGNGIVIMVTGETKWNKDGADFGADALVDDIKEAFFRTY